MGEHLILFTETMIVITIELEILSISVQIMLVHPSHPLFMFLMTLSPLLLVSLVAYSHTLLNKASSTTITRCFHFISALETLSQSNSQCIRLGHTERHITFFKINTSNISILRSFISFLSFDFDHLY